MAELKKTLGFWMVAAIAFLNLINTGIFFGVGIGAEIAGIDSMIAWSALAIISVYIAMCFGELTSMFPMAGGVYEFAKQAYGRFVSFLIGWTLWVAGNIATALFTVAAVDALPTNILPPAGFFLGDLFISPEIAKVAVAIALILLLNYIAYRGIEASARFMILLSLFMTGILLAVIIPGASAVEIAHFSGFTFQWGAILLAIFFLSETFFGWEGASFMSEETEDAPRVIPKALVSISLFVAILVLGLTVVTIGVLGIDGTLSQERAPILAVLGAVSAAPWLLTLVSVGIVVTLLGNASGNIVSLPRLLLAMSRDKLFIEQFSDIHPRRQTPYKAILFQTVVAIIVIVIAIVTPTQRGIGMHESLLGLLVPVSLLLYAAVIALVPYFRWRRPDQPRHYRAPLGAFLPFFVAIGFIALLFVWLAMAPNAIGHLRLLGSFVFFSIPIYLLLTYFYDPDSLIGTLSLFSRISLWFENILVPRRVRHELISMFHAAHGKRVLEFGSGVGTVTIHLAEQVGANGKIYAVGLSEADVRILKKRMEKLGHAHVEVIHDPHLVNRIHPSVKYVDMIVSIGHLGYIQDVRKVLKEMSAILPRMGHIYFVEYIDLFYFLPNPKWLSDPETIRKTFAEAGFTVTIKIRRGIFWKYLFIYGIKDSRDVPYI